jgi:hypothetical protein
LKIFDQTVIVLNSPYGVREVIDKRSLSSSNRPKSIISDMIIPRGMNLGSGRFGECYKIPHMNLRVTGVVKLMKRGSHCARQQPSS